MRLIGFPNDDDTRRMLAWLGDDYPAALAERLRAGLVSQDPGTVVVEVECLAPPEIETAVRPADDRPGAGVATRMRVVLPLRARVTDSSARSWDLSFSAELLASSLDDPPNARVESKFDLERAEPACG
jgi:hypothetical protein